MAFRENQVEVDNETIRSLIEESEYTTAEEVRNGKDIQGMTWETEITNYRDRHTFRRDRFERLLNDEPRRSLVEQSFMECRPTVKGWSMYEFWNYNNCVIPTIQIRGTSDNVSLLKSTTFPPGVYVAAKYKICHWNDTTSTITEILDLKEHVTPSEEHPGAHMQGFHKTVVEAMAVSNNLLIVGGAQGELICKHLDRPGISFCFTSVERKCINAIEIFHRNTPPSEGTHFMAADKEGSVRVFDINTFQFSHFQFPWPVKHASLKPGGRELVVVGEESQGRIVDSQTGLTIQSFNGQFGHSCASAWHPDGNRFATGHKDRTCRIWDTRNLSRPVNTVGGNVNPISSICFTRSGSFMAMSEVVDYVHIYDLMTEFRREQEIDFFGYVYGLCFSPDTSNLYIGVSMDTFPTLLTYSRRRHYHYRED